MTGARTPAMRARPLTSAVRVDRILAHDQDGEPRVLRWRVSSRRRMGLAEVEPPPASVTG